MKVHRLSSGLMLNLTPDGSLRLTSRKLDMHYTFAAGRRELLDKLWVGMSAADVNAFQQKDSTSVGWLLSIKELGLTEIVSTLRTDLPVWLELDVPLLLKPVRFPWSHMLIFLWSLIVLRLAFEQFGKPEEFVKNPSAAILYVLVGIGMCCVSVVLHEITHLAAARSQGVREGVILFFREGRIAPRYVMPNSRRLMDPLVRYRIYMSAPVFDCLVGIFAVTLAWHAGETAPYGLGIFPLLFCAYTALPLKHSDAARAWDCVRESRRAPYVSWGYATYTFATVACMIMVLTLATVSAFRFMIFRG